jgi:hypothetical protein
MTTQRKLIAVGFLGLSMAAPAQSPIRIEIDSSWSGLGSAPEMKMIITGKNGRYWDESGSIPAKKVAALLEAISADPVYVLSPEACGISPSWLTANYARALKDVTHRRLSELSNEQVDLFRTEFTDSDGIAKAFLHLVHDWHTDDYPNLTVSIREGDTQFGVTSTAQGPFMLPWVGTDKPRGIFSCSVSHALFELLPEGFTNRDRLPVSDSFRSDLAQYVMDQIRPEWDRLDADHLVGREIAPIAARFKLMKSQISNLSSIDLNGGAAWNADLQSEKLPPNVVFGVSLDYKKNNLSGANQFLNGNQQYSDLVLSVPWLRDYLNAHPGARIEIRFVNGRSLSPKATTNLMKDLRDHGKAPLADRVGREADEIAFLEIQSDSGNWARALVFPNREVLLWHFQGKSVLGFNDTQFVTWDFYGWRSAGALISPDGTIEL